ncbi:DUF1353 domain-containing protein [Sphingomonas histidinilytica]|uniref:DUF1353 domain-containing protein n=1 Tax=Rhizorhabdus histidinilytica TaxID=439228 RepID=UPI001ADBBA53|nr:DUF1353 domain-containing protein [Rhizorhabdus histidinilytica]MBO9380226.1 DUF1353 domain-containing protein [Rhizorhabdus histidinilytica]
MMARFLASPPTPAVGKRPNGKTEYRASGPIIFSDDRAEIHIIPTGWRSDGVSWPGWLLLGLLAIGAATVALWALGAAVWAWAPMGVAFELLALFWLARPRQRLLIAAFVHDWACQQTIAFPDKRDADRLFNEAMRALGVPLLYRVPIYGWVRLRGQRVQWQQPELSPIMAGGRVVGWE